ncbi:MAG: menaquinone biosynthetic enzyme MqnA/MqnD family protein [Mariniblastus sp.]
MGLPKIGAVSYLNTKPLVEGLADEARDYELVFDLPSRLADRLSGGELDVALIPVIEAVSNPEYTILSDACIGCRGPVWSVKLMSRVPGEDIKTLSLDEGSRTSRALTRVLLDRKFNVRPKCQSLKIDEDWTTTETDATLIIGDRAMKAEDAQFPFVWDLGETWNVWTGLPFVFAVWAARPGADMDRLDKVLSASRDRGVDNIENIAADQAPHYGLTTDECLSYLKHNLHFNLGAEEKSGMELYFQYAADLAILPELTTDPIQLQFFATSI